jgi:NAD(P)-dependent dehydrogenase (short-subunit alcohol dehydrogenase family)
MFDFSDRVVIVAGAAGNLGGAVALAFQAALKGDAKMAAYSVSKSGMAAELKKDGINVNCVLPGTIDTPQNRRTMPNADHSRWAKPETIANVTPFLASDAARVVQGAAIPVYGKG